MSRKLLANIHLYLAAFFAPIILMIAISGGLYLFGFKGSVATEQVYQGQASEINLNAEDLKKEVTSILAKAGIEVDFDYVKSRGTTLQTRPTSREYYSLSVTDQQLTIVKETPDFVKSLVELHKGHGPTVFKTLQKITALALILLLITGLWMAFTRTSSAKKSLMVTITGFAVFFVLAL